MLTSYLIQPASAMRKHAGLLPECGGVYAMLLDKPEALEPALRRANLQLEPLRFGRRAILYIGATQDSLRTRVRRHLADETYVSTFRMSLGAVLAEELGLKARTIPGKRRFSFEPDSELRLSAWIQAHVSVAARLSVAAMDEEKSLIAAEDPLLNIAGRRGDGVNVIVNLRHRMRGLPIDPKGLH